MQHNQESLFDTPEVITGLKIEKIYASKGKNTFNEKGQVCDRCIAVEIGSKLHWIDRSFATFDEVSDFISPLKVFVGGNGQWGNAGEWIDKKTILLRQSETELFGSDSNYMRRSERKASGSIWWTVAELKAKYFTETATA